ncbi:hypothetical protein AVEN_228925-1 [Araneus ventricosus]|uniref:Uncharacterized protein n=1 Tax=Araneus ventricosus TaxID=182803 RepID=A0A4Y2H7X2_ARAVE|nr:hypothetical protein AVEN_228925-1 [Araneus ventricosus]
MTRTTPEVASPPNFSSTPAGGRLAPYVGLTVQQARKHSESLVESGLEPITLQPRSRVLITRPPRFREAAAFGHRGHKVTFLMNNLITPYREPTSSFSEQNTGGDRPLSLFCWQIDLFFANGLRVWSGSARKTQRGNRRNRRRISGHRVLCQILVNLDESEETIFGIMPVCQFVNMISRMERASRMKIEILTDSDFTKKNEMNNKSLLESTSSAETAPLQDIVCGVNHPPPPGAVFPPGKEEDADEIMRWEKEQEVSMG